MQPTAAPEPDDASAIAVDDARAAGCRTLVDVFRLRAGGRGTRVAYRFLPGADAADLELTYAALDARARAIALRLHEHASPGDRAILLYPPGLDYIAAFVGCLYAGVVAVPAYPPHPRRPDHRVPGIVADCGARVAMTTGASLERLAQWRTTEPSLAGVRWISTDCLADVEGEAWTPPGADATSLAMLQYTSGSTAAPRGVMLTHGNLMSNLAIVHRSFAHREDDSGVFWLPPFHDMGLIGAILQTAYAGLGTVLMPPAAFLQRPMAWLEAIARYRATTSGAPNFAYDLCVDRSTPAERAALDLSCWRTAFNGAEPVRAETLDRFARAFECAGFRRQAFAPCYGLAEATLMVSGGPFGAGPITTDVSRAALERGVLVAPSGSGDAVRLVSSGQVIAEHDVRIVDPAARVPLAEGEIGEVWVSGPAVGRGYWNGTPGEVFGASLAGDDRDWLRTGDLGALREGQLYVTGRLKDLVIVGGRNLHPQDLEMIAERSHPMLRPGHAAAFAAPGGDGAERLVVTLEIARQADEPSRAAAIAAVRAALAEQAGVLPDEIVLVRQGTIPRTSSGKIRRGATREAFLDGLLEVVVWDASRATTPATTTESPAAGATAWLQRWLQVELGVSREVVQEARSLEQLGLESLDVVRLVVAAERDLGIRVDASALWQAGSVGAIASLLGGAAPTPPPPAHEVPAEPLAFTDMAALESRLAQLEMAGLDDPFFQLHEGVAGATTRVHGQELLSFGSYNYLGLSGHAEVTRAAREALERDGTSVSASRLVSGERPVHRQLERELAAFHGTEDALAFVSGHATNVTTIPRLVGEGDLVVADALAHDSIVQGARLSGARRLVFPHNDWRALDSLLTDLRRSYRRVLVVIEGVYSADGDVPELASFVEVKRRHGAMLMVDEAHSLGVLGATGRGIVEHAGLSAADVDVLMGTMSKTLASCGGYIAGSTRLVRYLRYTAPGFVFSVGLSPANAAAALEALRVLRREPERVTRLRANAVRFQQLAAAAGADTGTSGGASAVVPAIVGDSLRAVRIAHRLRELGVSAPPMVAPSVPERLARIRFFVTAEHTPEQLERAANALGRALREHPP